MEFNVVGSGRSAAESLWTHLDCEGVECRSVLGLSLVSVG